MNDGDKLVMIYSTFPDTATAKQVGKRLVEHELAACVNIIPQMTSVYFWEGKLNCDDEAVMLIKTRASLASRVVEEVEAQHPYETPAVLVLEVAGGARAYVSWLLAQTEAK
jgi:periplasmic divalent cation tolerance protein